MLYSKGEGLGIIQYHHMMLVIDGPGSDPKRYYTLELSRHSSEYRDIPVFGVFEEDGHRNKGESSDWLDIHPFLLRAVWAKP